jgi:hypothetical protein
MAQPAAGCFIPHPALPFKGIGARRSTWPVFPLPPGEADRGRLLARPIGAASLASLAPTGGEGLGEGEGAPAACTLTPALSLPGRGRSKHPTFREQPTLVSPQGREGLGRSEMTARGTMPSPLPPGPMVWQRHRSHAATAWPRPASYRRKSPGDCHPGQRSRRCGSSRGPSCGRSAHDAL